MITRPEPGEYSEYVGQYIAQVEENADYAELLARQKFEVLSLFGGMDGEQAEYRYEQGKWSIKEMLGHLADSEHIFSYRLLRIARGETEPLPGFEQDDYVKAAEFDRLPLRILLTQYETARNATLALLPVLPDDCWTRSGTVSGSRLSARAALVLLIGHERHHLNILKERYLK